jgi:hypothetical protein
VNTLLIRDGTAALDEAAWRPRAGAVRMPKRLRWRALAAVAMIALVALTTAADRWLRITTRESIPAPPAPAAGLFADAIPIAVTVSTTRLHGTG